MTRTGARRRVEALAADLTATGLTALNASRLDPAAKQKLRQLARYLLVRDA
jgi:geranylgeranyl pyrophosphate synthase